MSKYLPAPVLGKSGHGLHYTWKYTSNCEQPGGKQAALIGICSSRTNPSYSGTLRAPKRSLTIWPCLPASPSSYVSSLAHQTPATHTFFASNPKLSTSFAIALLQLGELPSSLQILVTSPMSPPQTSPNSSLRHLGSFQTHTLYLTLIFHFFPPSFKNISLSPETGFIYLAQITQS